MKEGTDPDFYDYTWESVDYYYEFEMDFTLAPDAVLDVYDVN